MARKSEMDEHAVTELTLFIENEYDLIGAPNSQGVQITKNLARKILKGTYDSAKAVQLWAYLAETGAKRYDWEMDGRPGGRYGWQRYGIPREFTKATRTEVARGLAQAFEEEVKDGNVDLKALAAR